MGTTAQASIASLIDLWAASQAQMSRSTQHVGKSRRWVLNLATDMRWQTPQDVTPASVEDWLTAASGRGLKAHTRNNVLSAVRQFSKWMVRREELTRDPLAAMSMAREYDGAKRRALTHDEVSRLIAVAREDEASEKPRSRARRSLLYMLAVASGMRYGEIVATRWSDVKLGSPQPHVAIPRSRAKSRKDQVAFLPPWLVAQLEQARMGQRPEDWVIPREPRPRDRVFASDFAAAGIGPVDGQAATFHSLRHTFITNLGALPGVSQATVTRAARHGSAAMTAKYLHDEQLPMSQAVARLPDPVAGGFLSGKGKIGLTNPGEVADTDGVQAQDPMTTAIQSRPQNAGPADSSASLNNPSSIGFGPAFRGRNPQDPPSDQGGSGPDGEKSGWEDLNLSPRNLAIGRLLRALADMVDPPAANA